MADDVTITVHVRDLTGPGFNSVSRNLNQLQRQASQMGGSLRIVGGQLDDVAASASNAGRNLGGGMGLRGQAIAVAGALGTTLLPTVGALAPMLTGLAAVAGGGALALDDLKKKAKELKKPFEEWQKVAEKAVAPHTEKAVKSLKGAMKDLTPVIEVGAETFGRITEKAAKFADSPAFKGALIKNAQLGSQWVEEFAGSLGRFTQAFLDFGTKSKPALDAWQELLGGFLDTGLPGMFKELEQGISGSSKFLSGFASFLNDGLLPALGKVAGSFAEAFGPLGGELLRIAGQAVLGFATVFEGAMEVLKPVALIAADALHAVVDVFRIGSEVAGSFAKNVGGALLDSLLAVVGVDTSGLTSGGFTKLSDWVRENEPMMRAAFYAIADGITTMVTVGISMLPGLWTAFRLFNEIALTAIDGVISGLAAAFGDIPGMGWLNDANKEFDEFAAGARSAMDEAGQGIDTFVGEAVPRLNRAKLSMNVDEAKANLASLKRQLEDPGLTKERKAKLSADKKEAEARLSEAKRQLADFDRRKVEASLQADPSNFFTALRRVNGAKVNPRTGRVDANTNSFWSRVRSIPSVVGQRYIDVAYRQVDSSLQPRFRAQGGPIRLAEGGSPTGGRVVGPGTETSDSIPAMLSAGEYVIRASSVRKYGEAFMDAVNRGQLKVAAFAKGGKASKAEQQARKDAWSDLTISHFGQMAGYQRSEFASALAKPDSLSSLVNALNQWASIIRKATHGTVEKSLLKALDSAGKRLISWEKKLGKVEAELDKAKDKLSSLKQAASQLADSVKSGVLSSANITRGAGSGPVTVSSIMGGLISSRDKATAFAQALKDLQSSGLSSALIQQVAEAGIEGGGLETAGALLGASQSEIKTMNDLQAQISKAATSAGKTTADAVYGKAIALQERIVGRLTAQQRSLTTAMDKLTKTLEKMIEGAFKGKAAGGIVGAAASGGIRSNLTWVGEQGPELLDLPAGARVWSHPDSRRMQQQAWASMLNTPQRATAPARAAAAPAAGDGQPIVIQLRISQREFGELWVDTGRQQVRTHGGIQATLLPPRGR